MNNKQEQKNDEQILKTFESTENIWCHLFDRDVLPLDNLIKKDSNFPKSPSEEES
jgi:hypothetical protein